MNVEPPDFAKSLPEGIRKLPDNGVYAARSASRPGHWHRLDVTLLQCDCERATKGRTRKAAKENGGCPPYEAMCDHLKKALAYDSMIHRAAQQTNKEQQP